MIEVSNVCTRANEPFGLVRRSQGSDDMGFVGKGSRILLMMRRANDVELTRRMPRENEENVGFVPSHVVPFERWLRTVQRSGNRVGGGIRQSSSPSTA